LDGTLGLDLVGLWTSKGDTPWLMCFVLGWSWCFSPLRGGSFTSAVGCKGERNMNWIYVAGGVVTAVLMVYLFVALLKPELF
jgi:K+-transporting ATPase KdpF subunit